MRFFILIFALGAIAWNASVWRPMQLPPAWPAVAFVVPVIMRLLGLLAILMTINLMFMHQARKER